MTPAPHSPPTPAPPFVSGVLPGGQDLLPLLLEFLRGCERSGVLWVETPHGAATLHHDRGTLTHIAYQTQVGENALAVLMQVDTDCPFRFESGPAAPERSVHTSLGHLLMSAAQLLDEGRAPALGSGTVPNPAGMVAPAPLPAIDPDLLPVLRAPLQDLALGPGERAALARIDGRTSAADLARESGLELPVLLGALARAVQAGAVELQPPLMNPQWWAEVLRQTHAAAPKRSGEVVTAALARVGAAPGRVPVTLGRALLRAVEDELGPEGSAPRTAFRQASFRLRQMVSNANGRLDD